MRALPHGRSRLIAFVLATLAMAGFVLTACGGDDDDAKAANDAIRKAVKQGNISDGNDAAGDLPNPCALVTVDDATRLFGEPARKAKDSSPVPLGVSCLYEAADADANDQVGHLLQVHAYDGEQFYGADTFDDEQSIDDLGDKAFVRTGTGAQGVDVQFVQAGKTVTISYSTVNIGVAEADQVDAADHRDDVIALARRAADRV
jgi:hypothetical protein